MKNVMKFNGARIDCDDADQLFLDTIARINDTQVSEFRLHDFTVPVLL